MKLLNRSVVKSNSKHWKGRYLEENNGKAREFTKYETLHGSRNKNDIEIRCFN